MSVAVLSDMHEVEGMLQHATANRETSSVEWRPSARHVVFTAALAATVLMLCEGPRLVSHVRGARLGFIGDSVLVNSSDSACADWDVRLAGGHGRSGVPMVYKNGSFHPVCGAWFWNNNKGAEIFCRQMGYDSGKVLKLSSYPHYENSSYGVDAMQIKECGDGSGTTLESCTVGDTLHGSGFVGAEKCLAGSRGMAVEVVCSGSAPGELPRRQSNIVCEDTKHDGEYGLPPPLPSAECMDWDVRLAGGPGPIGTPLVFMGGGFHPICERWFSNNDNGASIICRQLGYDAGRLMKLVKFPDQNSTYMQESLFVKECANSTAPTLASCTAGDTEHHTGSLGVTVCGPGLAGLAVQVACSGGSSPLQRSNEACQDDKNDTEYELPAPVADVCTDWDVRLSGSGNVAIGLPEVFMDGAFRPICANWFADNNNGAKIFCRQLGYDSGNVTKLASDPTRKSFYDKDAIFIKKCASEDHATLAGCGDGNVVRYDSGALGMPVCAAGRGGVAVEISCTSASGASPSELPLESNPACSRTTSDQSSSPDHMQAAEGTSKRGCADWDSRLVSSGNISTGTPEVFMNGSFHPICGRYFWNNNNGATIFCRRMGYSAGSVTKVDSTNHGLDPYNNDAVFVKTCGRPELATLKECDGGDTLHSSGSLESEDCRAGKPVAIEVSCSGKGRPIQTCEDSITRTSTTTTTTVGPTRDRLWSVVDMVAGRAFTDMNFDRCALVGASNVLVGAAKGTEIDGHDAVIRVNRIPTAGFWNDYGGRTDVLFVSNEWGGAVALMGGGGESPPVVGCGGMDNCRNAAIIKRGDFKPCDKLGMAKAWGLDHTFVGCEHRNISLLVKSIASLGGKMPTGGLHAFFTFVPVCRELNLYGFGGSGTGDGHKEWSEHPLYAEHIVQDQVAAGDWWKLRWNGGEPAARWIEANSGKVEKIVGKNP